MRRRLDRDGGKVLADWLDHYKPLEQTRRLITEALDAYSKDENQLRFHAQIDPSNPGEVVIEPEAGLTVHVRALDAERFTLVRIIDGRNWAGD